MKKNINNKGFAISTLLYGLLVVVMLILTLIISTMAYNRSSTKSLISEVISDLEKNYSKTTTVVTNDNNTNNNTPTLTYNQNIVAMYNYEIKNCSTGDESVCDNKKTDCYKNLNANSCPPGTIVKYKVNNSTTKFFYVLHDDGSTITMQQRENTTGYVAWVYGAVYAGPVTALDVLEKATENWTNVNSQTYTLGSTTFLINANTNCQADKACSYNIYTLSSRTARARMITLQEAYSLGCRISDRSCPEWLYNFLKYSTDYGGTKNYDDPNGYNYGYWTMSSYSSENVWDLSYRSSSVTYVTDPNISTRAVVEINKM